MIEACQTRIEISYLCVRSCTVLSCLDTTRTTGGWIFLSPVWFRHHSFGATRSQAARLNVEIVQHDVRRRAVIEICRLIDSSVLYIKSICQNDDFREPRQ